MSTVKRYLVDVGGSEGHERKRDAEAEAKDIGIERHEAWLEGVRQARADHDRTIAALEAAGEPVDGITLTVAPPPPAPEVRTVEFERLWQVVEKPSDDHPAGAVVVGPGPDRDVMADELERLKRQVGGEDWRGPKVEHELQEVLVPVPEPVEEG